MIPISKLAGVDTIIVHDNCSDGLASAMILKDALQQAGRRPKIPEIRFIQHGTAACRSLEPSPNVLFCDFVPPIRTVKIVGDGIETFKIDPEAQPILQRWVDAGTLVL